MAAETFNTITLACIAAGKKINTSDNSYNFLKWMRNVATFEELMQFN